MSGKKKRMDETKEKEQTNTGEKDTAPADRTSVRDASFVRAPEAVCMTMIVAALFLFGILFFALPKKSFSENENRNLARFPAFEAKDLTGGVYTGKVEDYIADHFPARDTWMALATEAERLSGKKLINGVYLANGRLIDAYETPQHTDRAVQSFVRFANALPKDITVELMLVPTAALVYRDTLPRFSPVAQPPEDEEQIRVIEDIYARVEEETGGRVVTIDVVEGDYPVYGLYERRRGENGTDAYYFRTDHHWSLDGAYVGYGRWIAERPNHLKTQTTEAQMARGDYLYAHLYGEYRTRVSSSFRGTTWSKLNDPYFAPDVIEAYVDPAWDISVTYTDTGVTQDTPYNEERLSQKDRYSYFLDGIHPLVIIENHAAPEGIGAIAIVKDSYANIMIPFMIRDFETIYVFDPRYYREGISDFIKEHPEIKEVLLLYNLGTMDTDAGIGGIF
ncbi:MAG: hypothetical protein IJQ12_05435 [Lachnospiraceae bacterium]|nr:hypothetical protein [Lachnospiraceae bacterium]